MGLTIALVGEPGAGKTFQARFLGENTTFVDLEGGTLSIRHPMVIEGEEYQPYRGRVIGEIPDWETLSDLMVLITGPDSTRKDDESFSIARHKAAKQRYGEIASALSASSVIFIDSLTWACRFAYEWACAQPRVWTQKGNRPVMDTWAVYRLLADEMVRMVRMCQTFCASTGATIVMTALLERTSEGGFAIQLHGQRTGEEMRAVFDEIVVIKQLAQMQGGYVLAEAAPADAPRVNAFVCGRNPWGLPAKDRSGRLPMLLQPRLDVLISKLKEIN